MEKYKAVKDIDNIYTGIYGENGDWYKIGHETIKAGTILYNLFSLGDGMERFGTKEDEVPDCRTYDFSPKEGDLLKTN